MVPTLDILDISILQILAILDIQPVTLVTMAWNPVPWFMLAGVLTAMAALAIFEILLFRCKYGYYTPVLSPL